MDIDGIAYLMMAQGPNQSPPKRVSSMSMSESWSDMSEVDWPLKKGSQSDVSGVDTTDSGFLGGDLAVERLSKSLDFDVNDLAVDPYPQFDSLDSSHPSQIKTVTELGSSLNPLGRCATVAEDVSQPPTGAPPGSCSPSTNVNGTQSKMNYNLTQNDRPDSSDDEPMDEPDSDQGEKLKLKLLTVWNNMKHGII